MATATTKAKALDRIKMRIRKGDTVQVISGKDKGKTGAVLRTLPNENRVVVEGVNMRTPHEKPTQEGESGRIVTEEAALHASNVMLFSTDKKVASRVEIVVEKDGTKKRRLKKTGEVIDCTRLLTKPRSNSPRYVTQEALPGDHSAQAEKGSLSHQHPRSSQGGESHRQPGTWRSRRQRQVP